VAAAQQFPAFTADAVDDACPRCGEAVLIVWRDGVPLAADLPELLAEFPCPLCEDVRTRGNARRTVCPRCFGLGQIGVSLPPYGLAVDASGAAREFTAAEPPREGEAAYLPHSCG
jgi:hypothetical protein